MPGVLYGSVVMSTIAKGRVTRLDISAAMGVKGVTTVLTPRTVRIWPTAMKTTKTR